ncbi:hypothetical protein LINPERPRIM_LOCUS36751 [Linum perenne]
MGIPLFIRAMVDLVELKQVENGNLCASGYTDIERIRCNQIRACTLKADPHIKSKHRFFKDKFLAQLELKNVNILG